MRMTTPVNQVARMITRASIGDSKQIGVIFHPDYDPVISAVGNAIVSAAKSNLSGSTASQTLEREKVIRSIRWSKKPVLNPEAPVVAGPARGARNRVGIVAANHWSALRFEYGTAPSRSTTKKRHRKPYPATLFMRKAALSVAASRPGLHYATKDTDVETGERMQVFT